MGGGGSKPKKSAEQKELERLQLAELKDLRRKEDQAKTALKRGRLGRSSLIATSEAGVTEGFKRSDSVGVRQSAKARPKPKKFNKGDRDSGFLSILGNAIKS